MTDVSMIHHVGIVLVSIWLLSAYDCCHPVVYFLSLIYLYLVHERYITRLRKKLQFEERKKANQRKVLSEAETVRWLNYAVEKIWPVCMEQIASQKVLLPIIPWFLEKYKPWTAKKAVCQEMYLGRGPPMITYIRAVRQTNDDDHLVMELGINFLAADDMSGILEIQLRKRLGFGMWAKLHVTGMHVEGKVLVGVKFLNKFPYVERMRVCFVEPPYFQMTVKPLSTHGVDVTELPGIAGWLDKLLGIAFEQTLVEPNMLVVDAEKLFSTKETGENENWFSINAKEPIAYAKVEIVEASEMKPSDLNGLADPYVKGQVGPYRFRTKTQKKTLSPKWHEEFKVPITSWELPNVLAIEVCDKDTFVDDTLGKCNVNINDLRDGERHDMWLPLQNIKKGRLHLAITVIEATNGKEVENMGDEETLDEEYKNSFAGETENKSPVPSEKPPKVADIFEPIDVEGQKETGIWVQHPGGSNSQKWEPRKGRDRQLDTPIKRENDPNADGDALDGDKENSVRRGFKRMGSLFNRSPNNSGRYGEDLSQAVASPPANVKAVNAKGIGLTFVVDESAKGQNKDDSSVSPDGSGPESPTKGKMKGMAKSIKKNAEKSARNIKNALSRKGSRRDRDVSLGGEYSDEDGSRSSSIYIPPAEGGVSIVSSPIPYGNASPLTTTNKYQNVRVDDPIKEEVAYEGSERINNGT